MDQYLAVDQPELMDMLVQLSLILIEIEFLGSVILGSVRAVR